MKAVILPEDGGLDVLRVADVPEPRIGANDVLVRVRACAYVLSQSVIILRAVGDIVSSMSLYSLGAPVFAS